MSPISKITALLIALTCGSSLPALARAKFDGQWSVAATVDDGGCTGPYRYPIVIRDGIVDDAGDNGVDASGRAGADGRIVGTIRNGLANIVVEGRLRNATGSGRWNLTGPLPCTGRWTAKKTS